MKSQSWEEQFARICTEAVKNLAYDSELSGVFFIMSLESKSCGFTQLCIFGTTRRHSRWLRCERGWVRIQLCPVNCWQAVETKRPVVLRFLIQRQLCLGDRKDSNVERGDSKCELCYSQKLDPKEFLPGVVPFKGKLTPPTPNFGFGQ